MSRPFDALDGFAFFLIGWFLRATLYELEMRRREGEKRQ